MGQTTTVRRQQSQAMRRHLLRQWGVSLAGTALCLALQQAPVMAVEIPVTTSVAAVNPDGRCSLLEALGNANQDAQRYADCSAGSGADTIVLAGERYPIQFVDNHSDGANGLPSITSSITISGNGAIIGRAAGVDPFRLLHVDERGDLTLHHATITGGHAASTSVVAHFQYGGAIYNQGNLTLVDCTISGNEAGLDGGGIANYGTLTVINSTISANTSGRDGGGLINNGFMQASSIMLLNSTISGNRAARDGGALANFAYRGAGQMRVVQSTITANVAGRNGGGLVSDATTALAHTLVTGNRAGGNGDEVHRIGQSLTANAFNLFGDSDVTTAAALSGFMPGTTDHTATSDGTEPALVAAIVTPTLANNGEATATHALPAASPALDRIALEQCLGVTHDQRGVTRPQGAACDIGAVESNASSGSDNQLVLHGDPTVSYRLDPALDFGEASPAGVFTINATFSNSATLVLHDISFEVTQLDNGNYLLDAAGGPGQLDAIQPVADSALPGDDQRWSPGEELLTTFRIGLAERRRFVLRMEVYGLQENGRSSQSGQPRGSFLFAYNPDDYLDKSGQTIFLPLLLR